VTHFYSDKKNTQQMIKMMDLLRAQYHNCSTIYLSWDAASLHISHDLARHVKQRNHEAQAEGYPIVKTAPLPTGAQFLNVIESVFSGMARAIIHNSDYGSIEAAKERSTAITLNGTNTFRRAPKRAGRTSAGSVLSARHPLHHRAHLVGGRQDRRAQAQELEKRQCHLGYNFIKPFCF
jgi:hypothetical protein